MPSVTALELMNRVRLLRRQSILSAYDSTDPEHVVTLNALNMAVEDILGTRRYPFDVRKDGQIATKAIVDVTMEAVAGTNQVVVTGHTPSTDNAGDFVVRLLYSGTAEYANTAFRVDSSLNNSLGFMNLAIPSPVTVAAGTAAKLVYAEYILPDTVREVIRVSYQEDELTLQDADPTMGFDEWVPNGHVESGAPELVAVGGYDVRTHYTVLTSVSTEPGLRMIVWPPPDDEYVLNYSYYYRHPELTDADSTLVGVPQENVNDIIQQATATMKMAWDGDYAGQHFSDLAQTQATVKQKLSGNARRRVIGSWAGHDSRYIVPLGFPNRTIGS